MVKGSNLNCPRSHPAKTRGWNARPRNTASCTNVSFNSRKTLCLCICCIYSYTFGYIPQWRRNIRTGCLQEDKRFPAAGLIYEFLRHDGLENVIMWRRTEGRHCPMLGHAGWIRICPLQHCCIRSPRTFEIFPFDDCDQIFSHIILSRSH